MLQGTRTDSYPPGESEAYEEGIATWSARDESSGRVSQGAIGGELASRGRAHQGGCSPQSRGRSPKRRPSREQEQLPS